MKFSITLEDIDKIAISKILSSISNILWVNNEENDGRLMDVDADDLPF